MTKTLTPFLFFTLCALISQHIGAQPSAARTTTGTHINFIVKDQQTGFAVPGAVVQVTDPDGNSNTLMAAANGKLFFNAIHGKYTFAISANGYQPMQTFFATGADSAIEAHINLDPQNDVAPDGRMAQLRTSASQVILSGYVSDGDENTPLPGVQVSAGSVTAVTDSKGFFTLSFNAASASILPGSVPNKITIRATKTGYITHAIQNFYAIPDSYTMKISLTGVASPRAQKARQQQVTEETTVSKHGLFDRTDADDAIRYSTTPTPQAKIDAALAATVPSSIRVGTSCSCTSCSSVQVMTLEAYTQSGLDDEWISSWGAASLQAGAVAYRTYGAYYVLHPVSGSYDIASTTCNQAWESDKATSAINAAKATAGVVLVKSGAIFRAEYSAENNNAGCGDGYSGTGSTWPCISDARCAGRTKNGHGRGMCQWGSSFWASDKTYTWILNHYYNPGSVYIQLPVTPAVTTISFAVKDQETGLAVASASIAVTALNGTTSTLTTDASGKLVFGADSGKYSFAFSKSGYNTLNTYFTGGPNDSVSADINLDPVTASAKAAVTANAATATNVMTINGYVRDAQSNAPLAGVQVNAGSYSATSDGRGYFSIALPAGTVQPGQSPLYTMISAAKSGYTPHTTRNLLVLPDTYTMKISLSTAGTFNSRQLPAYEETETRTHGLFDATGHLAVDGQTATNTRTATTSAVSAATVPSAIRVITSCACSTCTTVQVQVMSLESYVATGVDDEWISSWNAASLQAGAVAYRSRGAWYVQHPIAGNYDVSGAACHQTWQTDRAASVKNAAIATAGVVLVKNGAIVLADYAAENNNAGCGDGYSGNGSTWPCISDARCAGRTNNGSGKGMCQWGSSFWGTDQTYTWILNHYYNPDSISVQSTSAVTAVSNSSGETNTKDRVLQVSPNPVSGSDITVLYTLSDVSQPATITLFNNYGSATRQQSVVLQKGDNRFTLHTSGLQAGIYTVTVRLNATGKAKSQKVVVVK